MLSETYRRLFISGWMGRKYAKNIFGANTKYNKKKTKKSIGIQKTRKVNEIQKYDIRKLHRIQKKGKVNEIGKYNIRKLHKIQK